MWSLTNHTTIIMPPWGQESTYFYGCFPLSYTRLVVLSPRWEYIKDNQERATPPCQSIRGRLNDSHLNINTGTESGDRTAMCQSRVTVLHYPSYIQLDKGGTSDIEMRRPSPSSVQPLPQEEHPVRGDEVTQLYTIILPTRETKTRFRPASHLHI
ncbi:hypothetical protein AVEN_14712-1 [Araneus ventricosus]|uniref:Uncharacterized protein n=1 Tax=Araneus ventricosus TaxID=182803 RepID=A0A4Y2LRG0_ARAVE|nr:hypothetical protein AVEN_14712-1 [Araneus ventricosus]